jgi:L-alanine-DL-glutamate epimerase-like enolase superfamily enzyme
VTELHARIDVLEGDLRASLAGAAAGLVKREFAVLTLTRGDGTAGVGEASPLPAYSPDTIEEVAPELQRLAEGPVQVDALGTPFELLSEVLGAYPPERPSSRFAIETALLDWLGRNRGEPLHRVLSGALERGRIPIADLVMTSDASAWPRSVDALVADGATHIKLKIGVDLEAEVRALTEIRRAHPALPLRLDGNGRVSLDALRRHASALEAVGLELIEEPVPSEAWAEALELPLPFALDETLRDDALSARLLQTGKVRAVVLKPMVLGGFVACFGAAERAADCGADYLVSHTFDGPIARAAAAELALALQTPLAAGLGAHPALELWPPHEIAALQGREIAPHDAPGLGLRFEEGVDA